MNTNPSTIVFESGSGNTYLYDPGTNAILYTPPGFLEVLELSRSNDEAEISARLGETYPPEKIARYKKMIDDWVKQFKAFFGPDHPAKARNFPILDEISFTRDLSNIKHLILEVTQGCNLNCRYCMFSGNYPSFRSHANQFMPQETAQQAIDYFFQLVMSKTRTRKYGYIYITFYGGEPLLNFPLIRSCVEYINKYKPLGLKDKIVFSLTTNGTLLSEEIMEYFIRHEFALAISLDGPQEEHDKNRIFPSGRGTFDLVLGNIHRLVEKSPEFVRQMTITATYSHNHNLMNIYDYFTHCFPLPQYKLRISPVRDQNLIDDVPEAFKKSYSDLCRVFWDAVGQSASRPSIFLREFFSSVFRPLASRSFNGTVKKRFFSATCRLNSSRLFTDIKGDFHICERINNHFPIGNCREGILRDRVESLYRRYDEQVVQHCEACPARHVCATCYAFVGGEGDFQSLEFCRIEQKKLKELLVGYVTMREINADLSWLYEYDAKGDSDHDEKRGTESFPI